MLHGLAHLAAHHALQFGDRAFHHAGKTLQRAADGHFGFDGFELALEPLNLAQALSNDRSVLLVELLQIIRLALILVEVLFQCREFLSVMGAIGFVISGGGGLKQTLQFLSLSLLPFDLVSQQGDLASQLTIGVVCLICFGLGIADASLDHRLVDSIGFSRTRLRGDVRQLTKEALGADRQDGGGDSKSPTHMAELGSDTFEQDFSL